MKTDSLKHWVVLIVCVIIVVIIIPMSAAANRKRTNAQLPSVAQAAQDWFGDGRDGAMPGSGNLDSANGFGEGVVNIGNPGSTSINLTDYYGVARINPGDRVLIHQTQGSFAGCWEINTAVSDFLAGTGNYTLETPLACSYSSAGSNRAQILRIPQYASCNVTGVVTPIRAWNGTTGGIFAVMCRDGMIVTGSISGAGGTGGTAGLNSDCIEQGGAGIGGGFRGGNGFRSHGAGTGCSGWGELAQAAQQGEGHLGLGGYSTAANGSGGGGGPGQFFRSGSGGGGGNADIGTSGGGADGASTGGSGGGTIGSADLSFVHLGGGGGGGQKVYSNNAGGGGSGGGIVVIQAKFLNLAGTINANGGSGGNGSQPGGGGSGGSILLRVITGTLGTGNITALGGGGGDGQNKGGNGANGRIRTEYCNTISGSTLPAVNEQQMSCSFLWTPTPTTTRRIHPQTPQPQLTHQPRRIRLQIPRPQLRHQHRRLLPLLRLQARLLPRRQASPRLPKR